MEKYEVAEIVVIEFEDVDVITTSCPREIWLNLVQQGKPVGFIRCRQSKLVSAAFLLKESFLFICKSTETIIHYENYCCRW